MPAVRALSPWAAPPLSWKLVAAALLLPVLAACAAAPVPVSTSVAAGAPSIAAEEVDGFAPNRQELELGELLVRHPEQRRGTLRHNPLLAYVARMRAIDIARRGPFSHVNRDGLGANTLVQRAGYALPGEYDARASGNNIESLGMGFSSARAVWGTWMRSQAHRRHLLGHDPVFVEQTEYGVGAAYGYWVVLIARPGPAAATEAAAGEPAGETAREEPPTFAPER